jgi:transcriptional regulator
MYIPQAFRENDLGTLHALMREYSFATLITQHHGAPFASHLPFLLQANEGPYGTLVGHMARANPQWQGFAAGQEALVTGLSDTGLQRAFMYISGRCSMKALHTQEVIGTHIQHCWGGRACLPASRYVNASSSALASCKSAVSNPSVNQP